MYKYYIIPKVDIPFKLFSSELDMNREEKILLQTCRIKKVKLDLEKASWEIELMNQSYCSESMLVSLGKKLAQKYKIRTITLTQDILDFENYLEKDWGIFVDQIAQGNATIRHLLLNSKRHFDGNKLTLEFFGELASEILQAHSVIQTMREFIREKFRQAYEIQCLTCVDEQESNPFEDIMTPEYLEALKNETIHDAARKTAGSTNTSSIIFGRAIKENAQPIREIEDEGRNIVIEGTIILFDVRELRSGRQLFIFDIGDGTSGISCKKIFEDKDSYTKVGSQLAKGLAVKIKGSVQYDKYVNELVMFVDSMQKIKSSEREDHAAVKRVELHAHTHMSNMDAVVSVKKLVQTAAKWGHPAVAITDHGVVQAFPEAHDVAAKAGIKMIYGMEGYLFENDINRANHIVLLAKNPIGLKNLYKLVSLSHLKFLHRTPRIPRKILSEYREGLILGSACEAGELIQAIVNGADDEELIRVASFYDYLEIQPIGNNAFMVRNGKVKDDDELRAINLKVMEIADRLKLPLVATCDVHFLNPEDEIYRRILMAGKGFSDADQQPPLYFRTTEEMLAEFSYLGTKRAREAVIENPRKIAESIEAFKPIPDDLYSPQIPGAEDQISSMAYRKAKMLYGENLPKVVADRLENELNSIIGHGFAVLYLIAHKLVKKSLDDGYLVGSRGSVGSSFVATMTDITEVNPLPPHWLCSKCKYSKFITDGSYGGGFDLPDMDCPHCGEPLVKNGHDIPFAVFMGFHGDKVPDIDLNFSGDYQPVAHKYTEELFGKDNVFRAGTIATIADKTAYGYVKNYYAEKGMTLRNAHINGLVAGCTGVKRTTGQHPGGIMVIPRDMDVHHFTPIQRPADDKNSSTITTHFDYHSISSRLVKLDILGHDDPTVIKMLEDLTGRDPKTIPLDDPKTMSLFSSTEALGVTPKELGSATGTYGIPEFGTKFVRQMLEDTKPKTFSELVRISGFSHGTDVWLNNAQDLIRNGTAKVSEAISARDDIMMYLIHKSVDPQLAFKVMEGVRKGKGIKPEDVEKLRAKNVPEWYINSCQKIKYMFPKAHAVAYVMMAYRIAYCKVHYPLAFYAAYFTVRATEFDADIISRGKEFIHQKLVEFEQQGNSLSVKEKGLQTVLEMALEMYLRGYHLLKVDLMKSSADQFIILEDALLPPLGALQGVGNAAAANIVAAREERDFSSIEDLKNRSKISKTAVDILRDHGCLDRLPETDQMMLFA